MAFESQKSVCAVVLFLVSCTPVLSVRDQFSSKLGSLFCHGGRDGVVGVLFTTMEDNGNLGPQTSFVSR
jgi:hypothetical protein